MLEPVSNSDFEMKLLNYILDQVSLMTYAWDFERWFKNYHLPVEGIMGNHEFLFELDDLSMPVLWYKEYSSVGNVYIGLNNSLTEGIPLFTQKPHGYPHPLTPTPYSPEQEATFRHVKKRISQQEFLEFEVLRNVPVVPHIRDIMDFKALQPEPFDEISQLQFLARSKRFATTIVMRGREASNDVCAYEETTAPSGYALGHPIQRSSTHWTIIPFVLRGDQWFFKPNEADPITVEASSILLQSISLTRKHQLKQREKTYLSNLNLFSIVDLDQSFEVDKVVGERNVGGELQFKIKWVGYDKSHNSWEPASAFEPNFEAILKWRDQNPERS